MNQAYSHAPAVHPHPAPPRPANAHRIQIESSLLEHAKRNDANAIETMFRQFIDAEEEVLFCEYFGVQGLWWVGRHSFACLTRRRVACIMVGPWGEVLYQDGLLEHQNSGLVHQPGLLGLYITVGLWSLLSIGTLGLGLLLVPYVVQWYYRMHKCGLVWMIREGLPVYFFTSRNRLSRANHLYRLASKQHDVRLTELSVAARLA